MALRLESFAFVFEPKVWVVLVPVLPIAIMAFARIGLYKALIRYITLQSLRAVAFGVVIAALALLLAGVVMTAPVPRSVPGIFALLAFLSLGGVRFVVQMVLRQPKLHRRAPVLIYGAGMSGRQLLDALHHAQDYRIIAFLDDDPELQRSVIGGKRVYAPEHAKKLIEKEQVQSILLAIPSASRARRREIVTQLESLRVEIKTIPGMQDIISGKASFADLREVCPEDLLGRDPVPPSADLMGRNIGGKVVMVTGAGGSIGSELCRQIILQNPSALILFEVSEYALYQIAMELRETAARAGLSFPIEAILGSVQHPERVRGVLRAFKVQTVYHAAAYKHVLLVEENVVEGIRNNVFGTRVLAEAARDLGVENFILISTDKAVRPTNFMGASKRMAELVCQALARENGRTVFSMVRFGNVLGSSGSVIPRFRAQIEAGGPVTVTHPEITRFFMTIPEASQLVIQASAMARGGDVFVLDMGEPVKILDLAESMIRLHGLKPYLLEGTDQKDAARGDIAIQIVGLSKGEKLYEELLLGNDPMGTAHPRILTATEIAIPLAELDMIMDRLWRACQSFDLERIRDIFLYAPLEYRPNDDVVHDVAWTALQKSAPAAQRRLEVVNSRF
ncbi:MAG: polysaccharide biosynthesis protein [Roseinatronobacter sp.]|nr:polysaccharide biosynthesis protein [Roseinatronobacter sp.]